ncbi:MAG TPA: 50S ribosomal protein L18 [Thermoanaerobaculia bacterium]|nr:50S ribosomal protein L18 [Thermoanaerobaculia bacterium]
MKKKRQRRERAHMRVRVRVRGSAERPRLAVYKSLRYIYAQVIDDSRGVTLVQANSSDPEVRTRLSEGTGAASESAEGGVSGAGGTKVSAASRQAARLVGEVVAARAKQQGIDKVVFDRGGYIYHGNVKALAEAAREKGLQF